MKVSHAANAHAKTARNGRRGTQGVKLIRYSSFKFSVDDLIITEQ